VTDLIHIVDAKPLEGRWLRLRFSDGVVKDVDLAPLLGAGGVFAPLRDDKAVFEQVRVDPETRTVAWPGDVDLDAAVLYGLSEPASGVVLSRRVVQPA
jgi:Protein of unknown function (DUF2442)